MGKNYKTPDQFVAMQECSVGNATVGDMKIRTATFSPDTPISEVWAWAVSALHGGRLMLQNNESETS